MQHQLPQGLVLIQMPRGAGGNEVKRDAAIEYLGHIVVRDAQWPPTQLMPARQRVQLPRTICE